jgi:predicted membrane metal-binding protein
VRIREPLLLPVCMAGTGIAFGYFCCVPETPLLLALVGFCALGILAFTLRSPRCILLTACGACCAGGMLLAALRPLQARPTLSVPDNTPVILQGCVVDPALISSEREKFVLELRQAHARRSRSIRETGNSLPCPTERWWSSRER